MAQVGALSWIYGALDMDLLRLKLILYRRFEKCDLGSWVAPFKPLSSTLCMQISMSLIQMHCLFAFISRTGGLDVRPTLSRIPCRVGQPDVLVFGFGAV